MELDDSRRYAAAALFTMALHSTQVQDHSELRVEMLPQGGNACWHSRHYLFCLLVGKVAVSESSLKMW